MKREVAIAYRIYPGLSKVPAFFTDKRDLVRIALATFTAALADVDYSLCVILDDCPDDYEALVRESFPSSRLVVERHSPKIGNRGSWLRQVDLLSSQSDAELCLFAEDDYLWLPDAVRAHVRLHRDYRVVEFSTPYDHPDWYYRPGQLSPEQHRILLHEGRHWRSAHSTTLTFFANRSALIETADAFRTFARGNLDMSIWITLTKYFAFSPAFVWRGLRDEPFMLEVFKRTWNRTARQALLGRRYDLWAPMPALATHLEAAYLSPGVDWASLVAGHGWTAPAS
jgi:hypothetical protein